MASLWYVPKSEFDRILALKIESDSKASLFADACRLNVLYMVQKAGSGHIGSSLSGLDLVVWLFLNEMKARDVFFSSKGHDVPGLYSVLLALGRIPFEKIHQLRRLGGLPGHPDIGTAGIATNTGSLGMGISKAKGMLLAERLYQKHGHIFVLLGDGELQEGQIWESLQGAALRKLGNITAIVDHNKMQSDTWVENVSDLGSLESKFSSFGWSVARCDGHDFRMIAQTLNDMRSAQDRPKILIADTIKAKGVSFMQSTSAGLPERLYPYHSGAVAPTIYRQAVEEIRSRLNAALKKIKQRALNMQRIPAVPVAVGVQTGGLRHELLGVYSKALASCGAKNRNLVVLSADLAKDCGLLEFERKFPDRFVECGIAEQDMVSQAGGLALKGCLPVVHSFASFLASRANEQIYNNATEAKRIIYTGTLAGLLPATPGHSHQAIHDISVLRAVPGLTLIQPADAAQLKRALSWAVSANTGSTYLRICSVPVLSPLNTSFDGQLSRGRGTIALKGDDALIITYGPVMLAEACGAAQLLRSHNRVSAAVMNLPWLNAIDEKWFQQIASFYRYVITIDDHSIEGGQGQMIAAACSRIGLGLRLLTLGISGIPACGQKAEVLRAHCLDGESIAEAIAVFVKT